MRPRHELKLIAALIIVTLAGVAVTVWGIAGQVSALQ